MSENNINWLNIGIGAFIILAIVLLLVLLLPFGNMVEQQDEIAVITINGAVTYDSSNSTRIFTSASQIENALNEANSNPNVKAIVLDINSKGGSQVACEEIADDIEKSSKPVVAYIGDNGLDESYLIASGADAIVASSEDYLKLKKSNESNPDNLLNGQKMIDQDYTQFIKAIAENRNLKPNYLAKLAHGKRYNGNEAKNLGLIDKIGNKNNAIKLAASKANATNYTAFNYPKSKKSLTETLSENKIFNL